jgi:hypothetical protein
MSKKKANPTKSMPLFHRLQDAENTAASYNQFREYYNRFRKGAGLTNTRGNVYEITTALADKLGRICRLVKHSKRRDPLPDMQEQMAESVVGIVVYMEMLAKIYALDMMTGFKRELMKAWTQHGKK